MRIQWRCIDLAYQHNIGLLDLKLGLPWSLHWLIHIVVNSPVTITSQLSPLFVRKSTFSSRYIVHPNGGGAAKLVCESCGAEYPYVASPSGCAFCAVMKESGFTIVFNHRTIEYRWSDWGWAVKYNGYYIGEEITDPIPAMRPTKFTAKHKAMNEASKCERQELQRVSGLDRLPSNGYVSRYDDGYRIEVVPYPIAPVQPLAPDPAIMASIFRNTGMDVRPGVGARSKMNTRTK